MRHGSENCTTREGTRRSSPTIESGALAGVLTYVVTGVDCEVSSLYAASSWGGIGTALIEAIVHVARTAGCRRLWLDTNDNVDALRFYQRRELRLVALRPGAVERSRATLKPSIPEIGDHGIPLRDELVLERFL